MTKVENIKFIVGLLNWVKSICLQKITDRNRHCFKINNQKCLILQFPNYGLGIEYRMIFKKD